MILFIASQESDYLQDLTYAGLAEIIGKDRIVDFPPHWSYHREKRTLWSKPEPYPRNLGFVPHTYGRKRFSLPEIERLLRENEFQVVVLASAKPDALIVLDELLPSLRVPWVFVDGGDRPEIGGDFERIGGDAMLRLFRDAARTYPPALIFKRELGLGHREPRVVPFPFSFQVSRLQPPPLPQPKELQVAFWAVESSGTRRKAFDLLKGRYDCERNGSVPGQKFRGYRERGEGYLRALGRAEVALSFRGEGFDTLRFWEIPAAGALLLSEEPTIQMPQPFLDRKHAVFCRSDLSDLLPLIDYYLAHGGEARTIAEEGRRHLLAHHTHLRRAEYFLERLGERLEIRL